MIFGIRILAALFLVYCSLVEAADKSVIIFGASGRLGSAIVEEGLLRDYPLTGVSRSAERLDPYADRIQVEEGDILDRERLKALIVDKDVVVVSVGGTPKSQDPASYIAATAAQSLIDVLGELGPEGPRLIFVGNLFTLIFEDGKTLLELGRVPDTHENYAMFYSHQIALDLFRDSQGFTWTVACPPNGLRLEGRTANLNWGGDVLLRDSDGAPAQISLEDFAYAIFEEIENENYLNQRFNVARAR